MPRRNLDQAVDIATLKAQIDAEILDRLKIEAEAAQHIYRRGFRIGELRLLVALDATSEVAEMPPLFRLPGAPNGVIGLVNSHGRVMPVVDLHVLFGIKRLQPGGFWLLTCGRGDAIGLVIDSLPERKKFTQDSACSLLEVAHPLSFYASAAYRDGQDIWLDVDVEKFLTTILKVDSATH